MYVSRPILDWKYESMTPSLLLLYQMAPSPELPAMVYYAWCHDWQRTVSSSVFFPRKRTGQRAGYFFCCKTKLCCNLPKIICPFLSQPWTHPPFHIAQLVIFNSRCLQPARCFGGLLAPSRGVQFGQTHQQHCGTSLKNETIVQKTAVLVIKMVQFVDVGVLDCGNNWCCRT